MKKPLIGMIPLYDNEKTSLWMLPGYPESIVAAGGAPVMLPLTEDEGLLNQYLALCDGFLFTGGNDLSPALYGEAENGCVDLCPARDRMEKALFPLVLAADKPAFGICRGIQLFNVLLGGTLWQDLPAQKPDSLRHKMQPPYDEVCHPVTLLPESPLRALLGEESIGVNSCHHQGIRTLAPSLRPMALAPDGLVEGVWLPGKKFVQAVQWHPEFSWKADPRSVKLLRAFVEACDGN